MPAGRRSVSRSRISICLRMRASRPMTRSWEAGRSASLGAGEASTVNTTLTIPEGTPAGLVLSLCESRWAERRHGDTGGQQHRHQIGEGRPRSHGLDLVGHLARTRGRHNGRQGYGDEQGRQQRRAVRGRYYFSTNTVVDAADTPLAETRAVGLLVPNGTSTVTTPVTIPAGTAPGLYYMIAQADGAGSVAESSESNNTYARQIRVD